MAEDPIIGDQNEGPQGVQGIQGIQGRQGTAGTPGGEKGDKGDPGESPAWTRKVTRTFLFVVAVSFFAVSVLSWDLHKTRAALHDTQKIAVSNSSQIARLTKLEKAQTALRVANRAKFRNTDVLQCKELEKVKKQFRLEATENHNNYEKNLVLLGIKGTPALKAAVDREYRQKLIRFAAIDCEKIPSSNVLPPPKKKAAP